ncbi:MAG: helix-hairpin-helix domain-containing protein [Bacteroidales bacterium]|jgi:hypothetical protein
MRRLIAIALLLIGGDALFCQGTGNRYIPEAVVRIISEYAESITAEGENRPDFTEEIIEMYQNMLTSPLNINNASRKDLERLVVLNDFQIESIIDYRKEYGSLLSIKELLLIPGIDTEVAEMLAPFLYTGSNESKVVFNMGSFLKDGRSQMVARGKCIIEKQQGYKPISREEFSRYPNSRYLGPPGQNYLQYKFSYSDKLRLGLTIERDGGERGIDYKNINVALSKSGPVEALVIGDYSARFGQGLVVWNSFSLSSSSEPRSLRKSEMGLNPYNSTDENLSLRGISTTVNFKRFKVTLFLSNRKYDARIDEEGKYTSLLRTGLHNTTTTLERRRSLRGSLVGANTSYSTDRLKLGYTTILYKFNLPYGGDDSLKRFKDRYHNGYGGNAAIDIYWVLDKIRVFGEVASDHTASFAWLTGIIYSPDNKFESSLLLRDYSKNYYAPYAGAVSRSVLPNDERGVKAIFAYNAGKNWRLTSGVEVLRGYHNITLTASYKRGKSIASFIKFVQSLKKYSLRYSLDYKLTDRIRFVNRFDLVASDGDKLHTGVHFYHEVLFETLNKRFDASLRLAAFNASVWDVRIYTYERDVLYGYSVPASYGKGLRWYINIHVKPLRALDLWLRLAQTRYLDRDKIGEGPDMIEGPSKSEAKVQIIWRF